MSRVTRTAPHRTVLRAIPLNIHDMTLREQFQNCDVESFARARCTNTPASMRMPHTIPTTSCAPGESCGCGKTVTVADSEL
jgi:hypothetical protein